MANPFNHAYTPTKLRTLNESLEDILLSEDASEKEIEEIIENRANLVESLLNSVDQQQKKRFAELESNTNKQILGAVLKRREEVKGLLKQISKASKAIKEYHQV